MNKSEIQFADNPIVAHRGAWKANKLPENSIASLKHAINLGFTGAEFDVRMTADNILVINHDPAFQNDTIEKTTFSDLRKHTLSNGELMPTLEEYLKVGIANNKTTRLVLEIKPSEISKERGIQLTEKVMETVNKLGAEKWVTYISFDYDMLKKIKSLNKDAIVQFLDGTKNPTELKQDGIDGADYHFSIFRLHPDWIAMAKKEKIILNAWTVNDSTNMDWLLKNQFDFITTNEPELLAERIKLIKGQ